jgi:hypothetical protein
MIGLIYFVFAIVFSLLHITTEHKQVEKEKKSFFPSQVLCQAIYK